MDQETIMTFIVLAFAWIGAVCATAAVIFVIGIRRIK
jgi:putative exporter of polyketide antibiotics